jgi:hypothetical protein
MQALLSLKITVWTHRVLYRPGEPEVPDAEIFNQTTTDEPFVRDVLEQFNSLKRGVRSPGRVMSETTYHYTFVFATNGVTTQMYWGDIACPAWQVTTTVQRQNGEQSTTEGVAGAMNAQLYGFNLLTTLHQRTGMPLPDWWHTEPSAP